MSGDIQLFWRANSEFWYCQATVGGRQRRLSTKKEIPLLAEGIETLKAAWLEQHARAQSADAAYGLISADLDQMAFELEELEAPRQRTNWRSRGRRKYHQCFTLHSQAAVPQAVQGPSATRPRDRARLHRLQMLRLGPLG
jgi:hypothetical protein